VQRGEDHRGVPLARRPGPKHGVRESCTPHKQSALSWYRVARCVGPRQFGRVVYAARSRCESLPCPRAHLVTRIPPTVTQAQADGDACYEEQP
jgi:hypothetical protein